MSSVNKYVSGTRVRSIATFTNAAGAAADPDTTTFKVRAGSGATTTDAGPTRDALGVFHRDIDTAGWSGPGELLYTTEWIGTGAVAVVSEPDYFKVVPAAL
jgi:hypothetical protein